MIQYLPLLAVLATGTPDFQKYDRPQEPEQLEIKVGDYTFEAKRKFFEGEVPNLLRRLVSNQYTKANGDFGRWEIAFTAFELGGISRLDIGARNPCAQICLLSQSAKTLLVDYKEVALDNDCDGTLDSGYDWKTGSRLGRTVRAAIQQLYDTVQTDPAFKEDLATHARLYREVIKPQGEVELAAQKRRWLRDQAQKVPPRKLSTGDHTLDQILGHPRTTMRGK